MLFTNPIKLRAKFSSYLFKRTYRLYPSYFSHSDYFQVDKAEEFSSGVILEDTLMSDDAKSEWLESLSRLEDGYKRMTNDADIIKPQKYFNNIQKKIRNIE